MELLVVGLGSMGKRRARLIRGVEPSAALAGVDFAPARREEARALGIEPYESIAAAVAAVDTYPTPLTVVDMGTATTIAVIDDGNAFLGGAVLPGLRISAEALSSRASLLPGIQLERPRRAIGKNTVECIQSGLMFGAAAMVDGLIDRMEAELGRPTTVVATGGVARFVVPLCRHEIALERDLQLKGLDLLYRKNRPRKEAAPDPR